MDRAQLLNDGEEAQRLILDGRQVGIWTALPGIIQSVDLEAMTCVVQPAIKAAIVDENNSTQVVELPQLLDVPIIFPGGGDYALTFPLQAGDEVLVVFSSRCIDAWWQQGGIQTAMEARMHDLSDGFAIPSPKSLPNVIEDIADDAAQFRNLDGDVYISLTDDGNIELVAATGKFKVENDLTSLKSLLTDFETAMNNFMTTLAGFSGGGAPVTQAMLQAPATTAQTALAAVLVKINGLFE